MQDQGQLVKCSQLQLRLIKIKLFVSHGGRAQLRHKKIQAYFAHGHQVRIMAVGTQSLVQHIQIRFQRLRHIQGMNTKGVTVFKVEAI